MSFHGTQGPAAQSFSSTLRTPFLAQGKASGCDARESTDRCASLASWWGPSLEHPSSLGLTPGTNQDTEACSRGEEPKALLAQPGALGPAPTESEAESVPGQALHKGRTWSLGPKTLHKYW